VTLADFGIMLQVASVTLGGGALVGVGKLLYWRGLRDAKALITEEQVEKLMEVPPQVASIEGKVDSLTVSLGELNAKVSHQNGRLSKIEVHCAGMHGGEAPYHRVDEGGKKL
jgi:hypothetical protein